MVHPAGGQSCIVQLVVLLLLPLWVLLAPPLLLALAPLQAVLLLDGLVQRRMWEGLQP